MAAPYPQIQDTPPRTQAIAGLNQYIYATNWTANQATDIVVYSTLPNVPANEILDVVSDTKYTVQFIGDNNYVQVTFNNSMEPPQYNIVTIVRNTPADWLNNYTNTNFTPSMLNSDFNVLTLVDQQNQMYNLDVTPRYNVDAVLNYPIDILLPVLGANQLWVKNSTNTAFIAADITDLPAPYAPDDAPFVVYSADSPELTNAFNLGGLTNGILAQNVSTGVSTPYILAIPLAPQYGGTGVTNGSGSTLTLGGATSFIGAYTVAFTFTGNTAVTFPTSGLLLTTDDSVIGLIGTANEVLVNGTSGSIVTGVNVTLTTPQSLATTAAFQVNTVQFNSNNGLLDSAGNIMLSFAPQATPVNYIQINNGAAGFAPGFVAISGETNTNFVIQTAGTGYLFLSSIAPNIAMRIQSGTTNEHATYFSFADTSQSRTVTFPDATFTIAGTTLALGGTNNALTANNGGIVWSDASKLNILAGTATANLPLLSGSTATPAWGSFALSLGGALTTAGALTLSGAYGATFTFTNTTSVTFPTSGTLATTTGVAASFVTDSGTATPSAGAITISGSSTGLTTTGSGSTVGFTGTLVVGHGGTGLATATAYGILCGGTTSTGAFQSVADGTSGQILISGGAGVLPGWTTSTYPGTNAINTILYASAANTMAALATANSSVLGTNGSGVPAWTTTLPSGLTATNFTLVTPILGTPQSGTLSNCTGYPGTAISGQVLLANGGTSANLTASNGGIVYSTASAFAILSGTATAQQALLSGASGQPQWTTTTYPLTNAINTIMYASSANVLGVVTPVNNGVMVYSSGGIPSSSTTLPSGLSATNMTLTTPTIKAPTIQDANGVLVLNTNAATTPVNYFEMGNAAANNAPQLLSLGTDASVGISLQTKALGPITLGSNTICNYYVVTPTAAASPPTIAAAGTDTNIVATVIGKGTGGTAIQGTTAASPGNAPAGYVGELLSGSNATAVAMSSNTVTQINTLSLTVGDWDVWGVFYTTVGSGTVTTLSEAQLHTSTATIAAPANAQLCSINGNYGTSTTLAVNINTGVSRWNVGSTTTVYLNAMATYSVSTLTGNGNIYARRVR